MKLFSERYNYVKPSDVIIRERITPELQNAICSCYDQLDNDLRDIRSYGYAADEDYMEMEKFLWTYFLNQREAKFSNDRTYHVVATLFVEDPKNAWYKKLDIIEVSIRYLREKGRNDYKINDCTNRFISALNSAFERLHFAYRIVDDEIVEINSQEEIQSIETALKEAPENIKEHLSRALENYAKRPEGDYRNSIKESISAVEAWCREKTGENTLGAALNRLESNGIVIPPILKQAFDKLYAYTNQKDTGIRHALMDTSYVPQAEEAMFMLVSCCTFLNYLNRKIS